MRNTVKCLKLLGPVVAGVLVLAACGSSGGSSTSGSSGKTYQVLAIAPLSGPDGVRGEGLVDGLKAAAAVINANGGVNGKQVSIATADDALDANKAVKALQDYLSSHSKPDLLIPGLSSQEVLALLPLATSQKILTVDVATSPQANTPSKYPYQFSVTPSTNQITQIMLAKFKQEGYHKIAYMGPNDATSTAGLTSLKSLAPADGFTVTSSLTDPTPVDVTSNLLTLKASKPDVMVWDGSESNATVYFNDLTKLGWDVPVVGDYRLSASNFTKITTPQDLTHFTTQAWSWSVNGTPVTTSQAFKDFRAALQKYAPSPLSIAITQYVIGYNVGVIAWGGATVAKSTAAAAVSKALESNSLPSNVSSRLLGFSSPGFTSTSHSVNFPSDGFVFTTVSGFQDGMLQP